MTQQVHDDPLQAGMTKETGHTGRGRGAEDCMNVLLMGTFCSWMARDHGGRIKFSSVGPDLRRFA
jgi:hypothetical protein